MILPALIVEIELRYDAGSDNPRNRQLMARVRQRDSEGDVYGRCLLANSYIIDLTQAMNIARHKLHKTGAVISFEFGPRLLKLCPTVGVPVRSETSNRYELWEQGKHI